jgi:hypothetical protein
MAMKLAPILPEKAAMTSGSHAQGDGHTGAPAHQTSGWSRLARDFKADWRRWNGLERLTATMVAAVSAFVPLYLVLMLNQTH